VKLWPHPVSRLEDTHQHVILVGDQRSLSGHDITKGNNGFPAIQRLRFGVALPPKRMASRVLEALSGRPRRSWTPTPSSRLLTIGDRADF
jgi:hypothetical protein